MTLQGTAMLFSELHENAWVLTRSHHLLERMLGARWRLPKLTIALQRIVA